MSLNREWGSEEEEKGGRVLTVLGAGDMSQDPEALGLQVGSTAGPLRHVLRFSWPDHRLVDWRRTVHHRVLDWESPTVGGTAALEEGGRGGGERGGGARGGVWRGRRRGNSHSGKNSNRSTESVKIRSSESYVQKVSHAKRQNRIHRFWNLWLKHGSWRDRKKTTTIKQQQ